MNITINSQTLAAELRAVNKVSPSNPAIAILGCVLIRAEGALATFYGTDGDVGLLTGCQATVASPGAIAVPLPRLLAMVERFADGDVTMALVKAGTLKVSCGRFASNLQILASDDFPHVPEVEGEAIELTGEALVGLAARVRYVVNPSSAKHVMRGVLFTAKAGTVVAVATDSKRLALAGVTTTDMRDLSTILPMKALDVACDHAHGEHVTLTVGPRNLFFACGARLVVSRALEGQFPNYDRVIPRENTAVVTFNRVDVRMAMERVTQLTEDNKVVKVEVSEGSMLMTSAASGIGAAAEQVPVDYEGPNVSFSMNGGFVTDFLEAAEQPTVVLRIKDGITGLLFEDGPSHLGVIMPVRA